MKNLIIVIIVILIIFALLSSVRFGFPNSRNPEVTKSWISGSQGYGPNYDLFDENVECYCSHDCFWVCKPGKTISRDDICDRCGMKWKWQWHYNK